MQGGPQKGMPFHGRPVRHFVSALAETPMCPTRNFLNAKLGGVARVLQ